MKQTKGAVSDDRAFFLAATNSPPPPEGFISPMLWGHEIIVTERFGAAGVPPENIGFERETYVFRYAGKPADFLALFRDYYGPTMNAFAAAEANGKRDELERELLALFNAQNQSGQPDATSIPATFLRVTVMTPP